MCHRAYCGLAGCDGAVAMRVPRAVERHKAGNRSFLVQAAGNGVRLGFEMLRLTARCCGEDKNHRCQRNASRCLSTNAATVMGDRPPIVATKLLVPANTPLVWSMATSRRCCTRNSLPGLRVMRSASG